MMDLTLPLAVYLANFTFAAVLSLAAGFYIPVLLGIALGIAPVMIFYWMVTDRLDNRELLLQIKLTR